MSSRFDLFTVFAEMRTGSNFLEASLNAYEGLTCHGEAFNPHFIGAPDREDILGVSEAEREARPDALLDVLRQAPGLNGFRYFHDHDPRIFDSVIRDARTAKIVLTRNPLDSYVSWKIAQETGQWRLTNVTQRKEARARIDAAEFEDHVRRLQAFQVRLQNALQKAGQTAFYIAYDDLGDADILNGLAAYLGIEDRRETVARNIKPQNPAPLSQKVEDLDGVQDVLARLDTFGLNRTPSFEPRRGPVVPTYLACPRTPLLYLPLRSGPEATVRRWMAALDGVAEEALLTDFNRNGLRAWKERSTGHRRFTVLRHPVARAHSAFCEKLLKVGPGTFHGIRRTLERVHGIVLPPDGPDPDYDAALHRTLFTQFLTFLAANLNGQTSVRVDPHWASQTACLEGFAGFALPDRLIREEDMAEDLHRIAAEAGSSKIPSLEIIPDHAPISLEEIYDTQIEALARKAYHRDYAMFGFGDWR